MYKMDDIKDFDVNELKISSDEIKEYDTGKPYLSYKPNTIKECRKFSLEYKGDKPKFRDDGRLYQLLYPGLFPDDEGDVISDFMASLEGRMYSLFKEIMDDYDKVNETVYGTGMQFVCEVDRAWAYDLEIPFRGSCEFEIGKVTCWLGEKYSNSFKVELIAKNLKVGKLLDVKSKCEEMFYTQ